MKAILKTFVTLPLHILFLRSSRPMCECRRPCQCKEDRWVPDTLIGAGRLYGLHHGSMDLTAEGLRISSETLFPVRNPRYMIVQILRPVSSEWTFNIGQTRYTIRFDDDDDRTNMQTNCGSAILLLDILPRKQNGRGACLVPKGNLRGVTCTQYVGPLSWVSRSLTTLASRGDPRLCEAHRVGSGSIGELLVKCGKSHISRTISVTD